ncbi:MAG: mechanosensitive ion channel family protein [Bacteroidota bacterium]
MYDFFDKTYYGNTAGSWAIAFVIFIASILLSKIVYYLISKIVKQFTKRTKSKLDDIIIDKLEEPLVFAIIIIGIWYGLKILTLSEWVEGVVGHAFYFVITFNIAWVIVRLLNALVDEYLVPVVEKTETDLDDQLLPIAQKSISISIWVMAFIIGLDNAGYDVTALIAGLGIGSFAFALAAKDSVSHLFGGVVLFTDKPFTINDRIIVQGYDGIVKEVGIRSTRIQTLDGRMVTLPNGSIANDSVINVTAETARKITLDLGLTYDTKPENMQLAMDLLQNISVENSALDESRTVTAFTAFGDFSLNIRYIYFIKKGSDVFGTKTKVNLEILKQFNDKKLEFAFPTQTLYTVKDS